MRIVRRRISVFQPETGDFAADPCDAVFALVYPLWLVVQAEEHGGSADDEAGRIPVDSLLSPVRLVGGDCEHSAKPRTRMLPNTSSTPLRWCNGAVRSVSTNWTTCGAMSA